MYLVHLVHKCIKLNRYHTITGPCVPQHLTVQYSPSTALLSWDVTKGGTNFSAEAVTLEGLPVTCETSNTSCTLPHLDCGQIYNISVTAHNSVCSDTVTSDPIKTGQSCDH